MTRLRTRVEADVDFRVEAPGGEPVSGRLSGSGSDLTLAVSDPAAFAGSADAASLRRVADELAGVGLRVRVTDAHGKSLVRIGDVRSPWWQRPFTRSAHLRVAGWQGLMTAARGRARDAASAPGRGLVPPPTPFPVAPTFLRRPVRRVTTTHDPARGGLPRLVELPSETLPGSDHPTHWLQRESTTIGSDPGCDLVLPGLAGVHAEVVHDDHDEYVLVARDGDVRVHGQRVVRQVLRTSARVDLGPRSLTFVREEYADHGRPHGGRVGGELGRQRPQPARPGPRGLGEWSVGGSGDAS